MNSIESNNIDYENYENYEIYENSESNNKIKNKSIIVLERLIEVVGVIILLPIFIPINIVVILDNIIFGKSPRMIYI